MEYSWLTGNDPAPVQDGVIKGRGAHQVGAAANYFLDVWNGVGQNSNSPNSWQSAFSLANIRHKFGAKFRRHVPSPKSPRDKRADSASDDTGMGGPVTLTNQNVSVTEHIPGLRRYARALVGDPGEADDLVQECLTKALARRHNLGQVEDLRAYLFTILHNVNADRMAMRKRRGHAVPLESVQARLACQPNQLRRLELRDLSLALAHLPAEQRDVVLLVGYEGMSYRETAGVLNIPIGTVMSRLSRGREALRRSMSEDRGSHLRQVVPL